MKKKLICTIMILNLIFVPCYQSYAEAGTLTVAGGSLSIGGLSAGALAGLAGPAVVAVFCGMLAVGIDIELTEASQQAGMTKTEFLKTKINEYCQEANTTANIFYKNIADNMSVTKTGAIELGNAASMQVKQFINWLFNNNMVNVPSTGTQDSITLGDYNLPFLQEYTFNYSNYSVKYSSNQPVAYFLLPTSNYYFLCALYPSNLDVGLNIKRSDGYSTGVTTRSGNGYTYKYASGFGVASSYFPGIPIISNVNSFLNSLTADSWSEGMINTGTSDGFTGDRDEWNEKQGVYDPSQGYPTTINPGLIGQIPIPADTDITTNVRDYLDALQDVLDGIQDKILTGRDNADGIPRDWDIPDTVAIDPTIGKYPPVPDSERTPVTNDNPVDPSTEPSLATEPLKFDLRNIFPFCIPFDIKDMLGLLSADPVAPKYTVDWDLPFLDENFTFTVDLQGWSDVAFILRKMELLAFVIGLALVTRNLIRG